MELGTDSSTRDVIKCCDCGCDCSQSSWIRSVKRRHDELEDVRPFSIPELDDLQLFSNPKVYIENEIELLRQTVSDQQQSIQDLYDELEKERNASSTAAVATMSAMQRLQREKADVQMELRQYKLYVSEKMEYDQQEILALEDLLNQREQTILALTCETQAYKHRMMSYGLTEEEADGDEKSLFSQGPSVNLEYDVPTYDYPPLKCSINENQDPLEADVYVADDENFPPADTPHGREYLKTLDFRISQMETSQSFTQLNGDFPTATSEKVMVGQSPRRERHLERISSAGSSSHWGASRPDIFVDSPRFKRSSSKKMENFTYTESHAKDESTDLRDDMSDRVYTIDSVHHAAPHSGRTEKKPKDDTIDGNVVSPREQMDLVDPDISKLYMRLQALEADRESMKHTLLSMRTEKAQMVLLKEIAQHLSKEVVPQRRLPHRKASIAGPLTFTPVFKWITSFVSWRRKTRRSKYMFGVSANNIGLQMVLEKVPRSRKWRCLSSTQV